MRRKDERSSGAEKNEKACQAREISQSPRRPNFLLSLIRFISIVTGLIFNIVIGSDLFLGFVLLARLAFNDSV